MNYRRPFLYSFKLFFKFLELFLTYFLSLNTRKTYFDYNYLVKFFNVYLNINEEFGIVMQGPVVTDKDFTYNTLKLYKYKYPYARILLSTWEGQSSHALSKIRDLGVLVIENVIPFNRGNLNINLQIVSSKVGINELKKFNVKYLLKVRTDQRMCKNMDFLAAMRNLQKTFPVDNNVLNSRLIICSTNSFKSRLYGITDMLMFGHVNDMEMFWSIPQETNGLATSNYLDPVYYMKNEIGEGYLLKHFSNNLRIKLCWSRSDSLRFIVDHFCIIDKEQLDLFWFKYDRFFESFEFVRYRDHINWERMEFSDWINEYYKISKLK